MRSTLLTACTLTIAGIAGCSDRGLQPIDDKVATLVDDRLDIDGQVCTAPPEAQVFPVKVMFIVDTSGSMQFTDPSSNTASACQGTCLDSGLSAAQCTDLCTGAENPGRLAAVQKVVDRFKNNPAVTFSVISFNSRVTVNDGSEGDSTFLKGDALQQAISRLGEAEVLTDYQGALSEALTVLERDMLNTDPVDRSRTKYVVIFLSDGAPNPLCSKGCDGTDTQEVAGIIVDSWCDLPREEWCNREAVNDPNTTIVVEGAACDQLRESFPAMSDPCQDYNTDNDVLGKVDQIMDLAREYSVGELRMHTAFLWVDGLPQLVKDLFLLDKDRSIDLLTKMAKHGDGLFRSFNAGQAIDFLDINYSAVSRPFGMTNFLVSNINAIPAVNKLLIDTDGDGLDDTTEFEADIASDTIDSDGDGYNDKLEYDRRSGGFDPASAASPVRVCPPSERRDLDGDGLLACEEAILGTDPDIADSDRDRIPDGVEFWFGTDPIRDDAELDDDVDHKLNGEEIKLHASPTVADPELHASFRYIYDVDEQGQEFDRRRCYDFKVRRLRLVTTKQQAGAGTLGYNTIMVYFGEGPVDDPRAFGSFSAACVRAQFVNQTCQTEDGKESTCGFKNPPSGKVTLTPDDFYPLRELNDNRTLAEGGQRDADPCVGVELP